MISLKALPYQQVSEPFSSKIYKFQENLKKVVFIELSAPIIT